MNGWRGFFTAALALIFLETVVQPNAAGRVSGLMGDITGLAKKFLDPAVPAIGAKPKSSSSKSNDPLSAVGDIFGGLLDGLPNIGLSIPGIGGISTATTPAPPSGGVQLIPTPTAAGNSSPLYTA